MRGSCHGDCAHSFRFHGPEFYRVILCVSIFFTCLELGWGAFHIFGFSFLIVILILLLIRLQGLRLRLRLRLRKKTQKCEM